VATKLPQEPSTAEVEELLETVDKNLDRVKVLYEQYFLGIQKQVPTHPHNDVERRLRDLTQMQLRSTRLRYRLVTLQQKFGSYNSYWRRTLRQIENGTYVRNLHKIGRDAARTGAQVPEEILAAMPKRMRDQVIRDREQALARAAKRAESSGEAGADVGGEAQDEGVAMIQEPVEVRDRLRTRSGAHIVDDSDSDLDIDAFFKGVEASDAVPAPPVVRPNRIAPGAAAAHGEVHVEEMRGPFLRPTVQPGQSGVSSPPAMAASGRATTSTAIPPRPAAPASVPAGHKSTTSAPPTQIPGIPARPGAMPGRPSGAPPLPRLPTKQSVQTPPPRPGVVSSAHSVTAAPPPGAPVTSATTRSPLRPQSPQGPAASARPQAVPQRPPPGMTDADVNALYANYVKAKEMVGDRIGPGEHSKLLKTINAQAPKIMSQYNAKAVDFSVVVKDNQVILRAKPKLKSKP